MVLEQSQKWLRCTEQIYNFVRVVQANKHTVPNCTLRKKDAQVDEQIIYGRCVLLEICRQTLKERHSVRI